MGNRQEIQSLIDQYIVANNNQSITGAQMNLILNDFATKIKFFKDENSVEVGNFSGLKNFLSDYKFFSKSDYLANFDSTTSGNNNFASTSHGVYTDCLDEDIRVLDPLYFSDITIEEAKAIIQLQTAMDLFVAINRQPELKEILLSHFQEMGSITINTPYTRAAYNFYASQLSTIIIRQPEIGNELISIYLGLFPALPIVVQSPIEQVCRLILVAEALRSIARQPELMPQVVALLNNFGSINYLDSAMVNTTRNYVVGVLLESMARQPEVGETLKNLFITYAGPKTMLTTIQYKYANGVIMSAFLTSLARQPELQGPLVSAVNELTNLTLVANTNF